MLPITALTIASIALGFTIKRYYSAKQKLPILAGWAGLSKHINTTQNEISEIEKQDNRCLASSLLSLSTASIGILFHPPLTPFSAIGIIYASVPLWQTAWNALWQEKKFGIAGLSSIGAVPLLLSGYYFVPALGYTLYFLSEKLIAKTQDHAKKRMADTFFAQSPQAWVDQDGVERRVPYESLKIGDIVVVNAGEVIPIDGHITAGNASIDQRMLTGEAQPAEKGTEEQVFASTVVLAGQIKIRVEQAGQKTVSAQVVQLLENTLDFKSSVELKGQKIADQSALPTLALAILALPLAGQTAALTILNACAGDTIRLVAPISLRNFLQIASDQGILIKDGRALETLNKVDTIVFDKTGTLTEDVPHVETVHTCSDLNEDKLLQLAAAAEHKQMHPIAQAIQQEVIQRELDVPKIQHAAYDIGYGLKVTIAEKVVQVGSQRFMQLSGIAIPAAIEAIQRLCSEQGHSLVYIALDEQLAGAIELHASIRAEVKPIIRQLRQQGFELYILSGDQEQPTQKLAEDIGIQHYFAETLPENKAKCIAQLQQAGKQVCFIGDGINDAIALKTAHAAISLRGASTIATDTAHIILMDGNLTQLVNLFAIAAELEKNMKVSLVTSIVPSMVTIAGALFLNFGVLSAVWLYNIGFLVGMANAMRPTFTYKNKTLTKLP